MRKQKDRCRIQLSSPRMQHGQTGGFAVDNWVECTASALNLLVGPLALAPRGGRVPVGGDGVECRAKRNSVLNRSRQGVCAMGRLSLAGRTSVRQAVLIVLPALGSARTSGLAPHHQKDSQASHRRPLRPRPGPYERAEAMPGVRCRGWSGCAS